MAACVSDQSINIMYSLGWEPGVTHQNPGMKAQVNNVAGNTMVSGMFPMPGCSCVHEMD